MKTTEERMKLLKYFLQDTLGEIPSWYQRFEKQWNDYQSGKDITISSTLSGMRMKGDMQTRLQARNSKRERVSVSSTCLSVYKCLLSSPAPYLCSVTYYLVLTTLLTYTYSFH